MRIQDKLSKLKSKRGFTLVELMIVVAIIGVLAVLAVVGYRKIINSSKTAEGTHMLGAIRVAQEAIRSETGAYVDASGGKLGVNGANLTDCYPTGTPTYTKKVSFGGWSNANWDMLNVQATGPVQFGYTTIAGAAGATVPTGSAAFTLNGATVAWPAAGTATLNASPWYIAAAQNDFDGNGIYVSMVVSSWSNGIMIDQEGE
jgi:type IV pilus assembly protein PilA